MIAQRSQICMSNLGAAVRIVCKLHLLSLIIAVITRTVKTENRGLTHFIVKTFIFFTKILSLLNFKLVVDGEFTSSLDFYLRVFRIKISLISVDRINGINLHVRNIVTFSIQCSAFHQRRKDNYEWFYSKLFYYIKNKESGNARPNCIFLFLLLALNMDDAFLVEGVQCINYHLCLQRKLKIYSYRRTNAIAEGKEVSCMRKTKFLSCVRKTLVI